MAVIKHFPCKARYMKRPFDDDGQLHVMFHGTNDAEVIYSTGVLGRAYPIGFRCAVWCPDDEWWEVLDFPNFSEREKRILTWHV